MPSKSISSLDLYKLVKEVSVLNGGFFRNVKSEKNALYILVYNGEEHWIKIVPGKYLLLTKEKPADTIEFPLTSRIKSEMRGKKLEIRMHGADRIVEIAGGELTLVIELFSNGNVILVKDGIIEQAMFNRNYGYRKVASGEPFVYPKANLNVFELGFNEFSKIIRESDKENLAKTIASDLALGGLYSEELICRAGLDKEMKPGTASGAGLTKLYETFKAMLEEKAKPNVIDKSIFSTVELKHLRGERRYFDTISDALEYFFAEEPVKRQKPVEVKTAEIDNALAEYSNIVDFIHDHFEEITKSIATIRNSNTPMAERLNELKKTGWELDGRFIRNPANPKVKIDIMKPPRQTLSEYYEKIKKLKRSLTKGAEQKETPKKLKYKEESNWYAKFRWFFTSGGHLVVIGRDNSQNLSLINKHVEKNDIVLHADVFGSPFGVIKPKNDKAPEESDLREAASMIASYSSAWKSGAGNLDVYWVRPNQVTKSPPSGESLKKGAFYIEGQREYIRDVPMTIYIEVIYDSYEYSANAVPYRPKNSFIMLEPGNTKRDEIITKIIKTFSDKTKILLEKDRLDKLIPQGRVSIAKISVAQKPQMDSEQV